MGLESSLSVRGIACMQMDSRTHNQPHVFMAPDFSLACRVVWFGTSRSVQTASRCPPRLSVRPPCMCLAAPSHPPPTHRPCCLPLAHACLAVCTYVRAQVFTMSFGMTFLAEWGDRSQIATIALATTWDPFGVTFGGIIGHSLCTGMAVIGGRMLAAR